MNNFAQNLDVASDICANDGEYFNMLSSIDVSKSESFNPKDKEGIFEVVESLEGGIGYVNQLIIGKMRVILSYTLFDLS